MSDYTPAPPLKRPDPKCKHENFSASVGCHRITKSDSLNAVPYLFTAELTVKCEQCGGDFMFDGLPWMISTTKACVNVSRTQASIPMKPYDGTLCVGTCPVEMPQ